MAKKFVRGITDVKTINNQDFDTNNVNDLLSDGQYNYIHRKKGKTEEYHNLTDNIKTIWSDNTDLLSVTNNNKTTNTATLHPKHDAQKEQVLESTRNTVTIQHGTNGTAEKTTVDTNPNRVLEHDNLVSDSEYITLNHETGHSRTHIQAVKLTEKLDSLQQTKQDVLTAGNGITIQGNTIDTNPQKVLEHEKLKTGDGLTTSFNTDETTIMFKATKKPPETNLNTLGEGVIRGYGFSIDQAPSGNQAHSAAYVTMNTSDNRKVQFYIRESGVEHGKITLYYRFIINDEVTEWREQVGDKSVIDAAINANTEKINQLTARLTALEEKVAQLHPGS